LNKGGKRGKIYEKTTTTSSKAQKIHKMRLKTKRIKGMSTEKIVENSSCIEEEPKPRVFRLRSLFHCSQ